MTTKEKLNRIMQIIQELTAFYSDVAAELPKLEIVADNTALSELKKRPPRKSYISAAFPTKAI